MSDFTRFAFLPALALAAVACMPPAPAQGPDGPRPGAEASAPAPRDPAIQAHLEQALARAHAVTTVSAAYRDRAAAVFPRLPVPVLAPNFVAPGPLPRRAARRARPPPLHHLPGFRLTGTKVFISNGDHELAPQIVHMVLARTPGAAAGTRGLSLFLVPKYCGENGSRHRNCVRVFPVATKM